MPACRSPMAAKRAGIVRSVKSSGRHSNELVPGHGRRDPPVGLRAHRVGAGHRAVLGVLVVVEEHAVALLLPPLAGGEAGRPPLHLAGEGEGGAPHLRERPAGMDPHVDVDAARARGLRPAHEAEVGQDLAARPGDGHDLRPLDPRHRDRGRRAARRGDRGRSARTGCGCSSRQPRLAIQARAAASRGTTSSAVRPEGKRSATTSTQSGRFSGARFW